MPQSIIGIGETVLDIVFKENQPQAAVPGGSTFNAMISLGRTAGRQNRDLKLLMITQIGDDAVADIVTDFAARNGLAPAGIRRVPGQSLAGGYDPKAGQENALRRGQSPGSGLYALFHGGRPVEENGDRLVDEWLLARQYVADVPHDRG